MKIATWNVNSINVRLPQMFDWVERAAGRYLFAGDKMR